MAHSPGPPLSTPPAPRFRPRLEHLDDRITPALAFDPQQSLAVGSSPQSVAVADFNSDGRADVVTANVNDGTVSVLTNTTPVGSATATFAASQAFAVGPEPRAVAVGDFNGDGRPDLVTVNRGDGTISVLLNTTTVGALAPSFATQAVFPGESDGWTVAVADFNDDGRPDIAICSSRIQVLLNTIGTGPTAFAPAQTAVSFINRGSMAVADFDGDGRPDIAYSDTNSLGRVPPVYYNTFVAVRLNATAAGSGTLAFGPEVVAIVDTTTFPIPYLTVATGDFDGDGRPDVAANDAGGLVKVARNTTVVGSGTATFDGRQAFPFKTGNSAAAVPAVPAAIGDFNGDGRADLILADVESTVSVLVNTTPTFGQTLSFAAPVALAVGAISTGLATGDFDGDGRPDVAASAGTGIVAVFPNASTGTVVSGPPVVGQFGTAGVWALDRTTGGWRHLTEANADALAVAPNGNVVGSFGDNGVWYYQPAYGWYLINGNRATAVAIDGLGNVYASFEGFGTAAYRLANGWSAPLTTVAADRLAVNKGGELAAHFPNHGLYTFTPAAGWRFLHGYPITALAVGENGDVVVSFVGYGVNVWRPTTDWVRLHDTDATTLARNANGSVAAAFVGGGVGRYTPTGGWESLHTGTPAASVAMDLYGNVFATLGGFGVYEFNPFAGWRLRSASTAGILSVG